MLAHTNWMRVSLCAAVALSIGAVAAFAAEPVPVFSIEALADTTASEDDPSMNGRYVAYERTAAGDDSDIVVVDLETGAEWLPTTNDANQDQPDMSYGQVAYTDSRNGHADIYFRSTSLWDEYRVTNVAGNQMYPSISGNTVIWDDVATGSLWYHNWFWDFQFTNHEIPGSAGAALRLHDLDGDTVVFARDDGAVWSLYRYTIGSDNDAEAFRTLPAGSEFVSVSVHDGRVVWTEKDALNNYSVYWTSVYGNLMNFVLDLNAGAGGGSASAFHDGAAWHRNTAGQVDVRFGFQGGGGSSIGITNDANFDGFASLYGRRVVYEHPSGDTDLHLATAEPDFDRLAGDNRYATAVAISKEHYPAATTAVLCTGENFPDALTAAPFARFLRAPLLLSRTAAVPDEVIAELTRLGVANVFVIGGEAALADSVLAQLTDEGFTSERVFGADRYETSKNIAYRLIDGLAAADRPFCDRIFVARGDAFPDALAVAPVAASMYAPILLTQTNELSTPLIQFITNMTIKYPYVVGGTSAISENNFEELNAFAAGYGGVATRWSGEDRYETAVFVTGNALSLDHLDLETVGFATGTNFPDALAGGAALGAGCSPLLLVRPSGPLPTSGVPNKSLQAFLEDHAWDIGRAEVYGGVSAVDGSVATALESYLH